MKNNTNEKTNVNKVDTKDEISSLFEEKRKSITLTKENSKFILSEGNLISLDFTNDKNEREFVERVVIYRCFPFTHPNEFLSVREPETKEHGKGCEIGMIKNLSDMDDESAKAINEELERRYFTPVITKIKSIKEKFGYFYFELDTLSGPASFVLGDIFQNIRKLNDGRIFLKSLDGGTFQILDATKLDPASYKRIEVYL